MPPRPIVRHDMPVWPISRTDGPLRYALERWQRGGLVPHDGSGDCCRSSTTLFARAARGPSTSTSTRSCTRRMAWKPPASCPHCPSDVSSLQGRWLSSPTRRATRSYRPFGGNRCCDTGSRHRSHGARIEDAQPRVDPRAGSIRCARGSRRVATRRHHRMALTPSTVFVAVEAGEVTLINHECTTRTLGAGIVEVRELLRSLGAEGHTMFVSSHILTEIQCRESSASVTSRRRSVHRRVGVAAEESTSPPQGQGPSTLQW